VYGTKEAYREAMAIFHRSAACPVSETPKNKKLTTYLRYRKKGSHMSKLQFRATLNLANCISKQKPRAFCNEQIKESAKKKFLQESKPLIFVFKVAVQNKKA